MKFRTVSLVLVAALTAVAVSSNADEKAGTAPSQHLMAKTA